MSDRADSDHVRAAERDWAAAAATVLRKAGRLPAGAPDEEAWERLSRSTVEGMTVPALGTPRRAADLATAAASASPAGSAPFLRGAPREVAASGGAADWDVRALIDDPDPDAAQRAALGNLEGGATSLWIRVGPRRGTAPGDLGSVLAGVRTDLAAVMVDAGGDAEATVAAGQVLGDAAAASTATLHPGSTLGFDGIGALARAALRPAPGAGPAAGTDGLVEVVRLADRLAIGAVTVDAVAAHEAGAGDAGEVGYALAVGAEYLRALTGLGLDVDTACGLIDFRYAATDDQFLTIAKLRAARLAWHRVAELSGAATDARAQRQHAVTSPAMATRYDPWVNMLRATIATFAAAVGGADAITALPFDATLGVPDEFGHRMARNISALLMGESHVGAVRDPAGGAHAVEMLTAELAEAAWQEFGAIEAAGGVAAALADGSLADRIGRTRAERARRIASRRRPITGVSEFPNPAESAGTLPARRAASAQDAPPTGADVTAGALPPFRRWAAPFEDLRDTPPGGPVVLVTVGSEAAAAARLLFTRNLLAAGGIRVVEAPPGADAAAVVRENAAATVMFAGADQDYAGRLRDLAEQVRGAGARTVLVAGRPAAVSELPDGVIDTAVAAGDDMLAFLRSVRHTLGGTR